MLDYRDFVRVSIEHEHPGAGESSHRELVKVLIRQNALAAYTSISSTAPYRPRLLPLLTVEARFQVDVADDRHRGRIPNECLERDFVEQIGPWVRHDDKDVGRESGHTAGATGELFGFSRRPIALNQV